MFPLYGYFTGQDGFCATAKPLALLQGLALAVSFGVLMYGFLAHDFSIKYVADNSNIDLPRHFRMSAVWGAHEGSLLLWSLILAFWGVAVALFSRGIPDHMSALVLSVMGMISVGFLAFMLFTSNPFVRILPFAPGNGADLNPLLQDPGLIFHPPMLYMGCRTLSRLCVCYGIVNLWTVGRNLGPLVTSLDHSGLGISDTRYCARQLVGLLRTWLGRLVVLGPS